MRRWAASRRARPAFARSGAAAAAGAIGFVALALLYLISLLRPELMPRVPATF